MFDILFGWRKASKCKKQIKRVQCRLKLLKNKRCSIVRQLRDDVAELLKYGHDESAFNRVEQLFKDESMVAVYDQLDHFCEFIIINLSYIRRHKDCPNDINEAVSSLIFASARFGDLPELLVIRKLFGERYGQRFAMTALGLLPGNLVNRQIKENLSIKSVPDDVKYILVDEIARKCLQQGPLALEYSSEQQQQLANKSSDDQVPNNDVQANYNQNEDNNELQACTDRKKIYADISSESMKFQLEPFVSEVLHSSPNRNGFAVYKNEGEMKKYPSLHFPYELTFSRQNDAKNRCSYGTHASTLGDIVYGMSPESSSESSAQLPEEIIYLDDIEEFESPMCRYGTGQDQRLFKFKSSIIPMRDVFEDFHKEDSNEEYESGNEKADSRIYTKNGEDPVKRLRKRSVSQEKQSVTDFECAIYYGEAYGDSLNHNCRTHYHRKNQKGIPVEEHQESYCAQERLVDSSCVKIENNNSKGCKHVQMRSCYSCSYKGEMFKNCSLEHPCYKCINDDKGNWESPRWKLRRRIKTLERGPAPDLKEESFKPKSCHCQCFYGREMNNRRAGWGLRSYKPRINYQSGATMCKNLVHPNYMPETQNKKMEEQWRAGEWEHTASCASSLSSSRVTTRTAQDTRPLYSRATTMPSDRPKVTNPDNILRSNSFTLPDSCHLSNGSSSSPHVHPKLPDYDELQAKFTAIKKENLQNKHPKSNR